MFSIIKKLWDYLMSPYKCVFESNQHAINSYALAEFANFNMGYLFIMGNDYCPLVVSVTCVVM